MYFKNYIDETKKRVLILIVNIVLFFLTSLKYKEFLLFISIKPYIFFSNSNHYTHYFITTSITELFNAYVKIIIHTNFSFLIFLTFFHFLLLIKPGFYHSEILKINKFKKLFIVMIVFYTILIYKILFFEFLEFFYCKWVNLTELKVYLEPKLSEYLKLFIQIVSISFLLSIMSTFFILYLQLFKTPCKNVKKKRKLILYSIFFITALITPPDFFYQIYLVNYFLLFNETIILLSIYYRSFLIGQPIKIKNAT